ncbi:hypothetical protein L484_003148 [Morus notabilis]|uniref:Uncharacterized protein n=1 Tax=Morus notabilis TaxID=981085 RepID=W9SKH4_9ROSA|nr:hypothetical protein L484_003148 [Morus notabilis]
MVGLGMRWLGDDGSSSFGFGVGRVPYMSADGCDIGMATTRSTVMGLKKFGVKAEREKERVVMK